MITADQIVAHAVGDYLLQSDWMANEKTKRSLAALCHVLTYALPFLFLRPSWPALVVIVSTHFVIDRWRLARFVVWAKNFIAPWEKVVAAQVPNTAEVASAGGTVTQLCVVRSNPPWAECKATGYPPQTPAWLAVWLLIIADNIMHVVINALALRYL